MLIRLMAEQIASNWDFLSKQIVDGGPLEARKGVDRSVNILDSLLLGEMQCWAEAEERDGKFHIIAIVVTQVLDNTCAGIRNLLIYSLSGVEGVFNFGAWQRGLLTLAQFARKHECQNIIAYTGNKELIHLAERFLGDTTQRVVVFPLD